MPKNYTHLIGHFSERQEIKNRGWQAEKSIFDNPLTGQHEDSTDGQQDEAHQGDDALEQNFKLLSIEFAAQVVHKCMNLAQAKHTEGCHVL